MPEPAVGANGHQRFGEDAFGFMNIIRNSLSARSVAVAHPCRSAQYCDDIYYPQKNTMIDPNKNNLVYFESASMKELFQEMERWQHSNQKRLLSTQIQKDHGKFCCIALTNPTEVVICCGDGRQQAYVSSGELYVSSTRG